MLVRLRDFAEANRVSQRTVQVCIKENYGELGEHIDRRGKQGTWLDEFAVQFILERIKLPTKDEVLTPTIREAALMEQIRDLSLRLAASEHDARLNAEAAGKVKYLEAAKEDQDKKIDDLTAKNAVLSHDNEELGQKVVQVEKTAQELSEELTAIKGTLWYKLFGKKPRKEEK